VLSAERETVMELHTAKKKWLMIRYTKLIFSSRTQHSALSTQHFLDHSSLITSEAFRH